MLTVARRLADGERLDGRVLANRLRRIRRRLDVLSREHPSLDSSIRHAVEIVPPMTAFPAYEAETIERVAKSVAAKIAR